MKKAKPKAIAASCPICKRGINATSDTPKPLDLVVCWFCASMLEYNDELELEHLSTSKFVALDKEMQDELNNTVYLIVKSRS